MTAPSLRAGLLAVAVTLLGAGCFPAVAPAASSGETAFEVPAEVTTCKQQLSDADGEVEDCKGRCKYGSYCCPIFSCATVKIEAWARASASCAEWGVTRAAGDILWPKPNTGETTTVCSPQPPAPSVPVPSGGEPN